MNKILLEELVRGYMDNVSGDCGQCTFLDRETGYCKAAHEKMLANVPQTLIFPEEIDKFKKADVAPVVHAHWEILQDRWPYLKVHECSKCGFDFNATERMSQSCVNSQLKFCPHCGARMDEKAEEKE